MAPRTFISETNPSTDRGMTLVELLVVIAVISLLLTLAGPLVSQLTSNQNPDSAATAISAQLERARTHATARNTTVWARLGSVREEPNEFFVGVYESLDGTWKAPDSTNTKGAWNPIRLGSFKLSNDLDEGFSRPPTSIGERPDTAVWIRFSPAGEAWIAAADSQESGVKMVPPADAPGKWVLHRWTELGIQPTRGGKIPESLKQNIAAVHLSGLTGQTLQFSR